MGFVYFELIAICEVTLFSAMPIRCNNHVMNTKLDLHSQSNVLEIFITRAKHDCCLCMRSLLPLINPAK